MSSNEWLPAQVPFDLVRRGFAPDQVTAHLERLEYDLRIATANGDATNQRLSEATNQAEETRRTAQQESQALLAAATAESERLISEATTESRATLTAAREE